MNRYGKILLAAAGVMVAAGLVGCSSIHSAAASGDTAKVSQYLAQGVAVDARDGSGRTPLYYAAASGQTRTAEFLMSRGAQIDAVSNRGETPLTGAAAAGQTDTAILLLINRANPAIGNAFAEAVGGGRRDTAVIVFDAMNGITPLHTACMTGDAIQVQARLGALSVNAPDREGITPLHYAARAGKIDTVRLLLARGANPGLADQDGMLPKDYALMAGHGELVVLLQAPTSKGK